MKTKHILIAFLALAVFAGCSDDFLERPPKDSLVDGNFFKNDEQVLAGTAALYSAVWKDYIDKANFKLGDFRGGTTFRAWGDRDHVMFNTTEVSPDNAEAYRAFYIVVGQANLAIHNINTYAGPTVSERIKNHAIAEARFMRATAYTHLVSNYDEVPIIENNLDHLNDPYLRRNKREDIWEFITRDYEFAAANLTDEPLQPGRLTKWSAKGMLARTYLTRAGVNGSRNNRNQLYLDKARDYADDVITNSGKSLLPNYADLFLYTTGYKYDNNPESLFELQWVFTPNYGYANTMVSQITYSNAIAANGDGWGGDISATWWMLSQYDGLVSPAIPAKNGADSILEGSRPGFTFDERLKATYMLPGFVYPEITEKAVVDGEEVERDLIFAAPAATADNSYVSIKKYVVGGAKDTGEADAQRYPNNTYMLRLAELYLIYAEAVAGNALETTDPKAIAYFNVVHERAGLPPFTGTLTRAHIFSERAKEFAMESMIWYDLVRLHYYDPEEAYNIINSQDRGLFVARPNQFPDPTRWTFAKTSWFNDRKAVANSGNFILPLPASEVSQAPSLAEPSVNYEFKD